MTRQERRDELGKLPPQRALFLTRINTFYLYFAIFMVVYFIVVSIINAQMALYIGDLVYALVIAARCIYWRESMTLFGSDTRLWEIFGVIFFICGLTGLLLI